MRRPVVWTFAGLGAAAVAASYWLTALNASKIHGATAAWNGFGEVTSWVLMMGTALGLGVLVSLRRPENAMGAVFLAGGSLGILALLGDAYAGYALVTRPGSLPGGVLGRLVSFLAFSATWVVAGVLLAALFPTGKLVSRRWGIAVWLGVAGGVASSLIIFLSNAFDDEGLLGDVGGVTNPIAIPAADEVLSAVSGYGILALFAGMFIAIISMLIRTKRSHGVERQQIKVVAYTLVAQTVFLLAVANLMNAVHFEGSDLLWSALSYMVTPAVPVALGVALLRYRLYDIDRLINRTIVYAVLSALLVAVYGAAVVVFGTVVRPFTEGSDLAIAAATLLVAVLFVPLRRRVQGVIDRRFYRTRYDAARTLEAFMARLRSQTDLQALRSEIELVAHQTMRPASVGLWLVPEGRKGRMLS